MFFFSTTISIYCLSLQVNLPCAFNVGNFYKDTEALNLTLVANEMAKKLSKKFVFRTIGLNVLKLANLAIICGRGSFIDLKNNGKWQTIELEKTNKETYYDREIGLVFYYFSQLISLFLYLCFSFSFYTTEFLVWSQGMCWGLERCDSVFTPCYQSVLPLWRSYRLPVLRRPVSIHHGPSLICFV